MISYFVYLCRLTSKNECQGIKFVETKDIKTSRQSVHFSRRLLKAKPKFNCGKFAKLFCGFVALKVFDGTSIKSDSLGKVCSENFVKTPRSVFL